MSFSLSIPTQKPTGPFQLTVGEGKILFVLGANGTGKSSLMQAFASNANNVRRIAAHRKTWFPFGVPEFTSRNRVEMGQNQAAHDRYSYSRYMDQMPDAYAQFAIYDLVNSENLRAREIARAVEAGRQGELVKLSAKDGVLAILNRLLRLASMDIVISIEANDEIVATRNGSKCYSIAKLSDGERNSILIAINVLTAPVGALLLIDEPERHLHHSIMSPLLSLLLKERIDCAFVISTHAITLPIDNPDSQVLLTRSCTYDGDSVVSYDVDLIDGMLDVDEDLKRAILGQRRKIMFVEGTDCSLDKSLYTILFPNVSIVAKTSCREVENAVFGIKNAAKLHWINSFGFVDGDSAEPTRIAELQAKGLIVLNFYSVESIYYHPDVQKLATKGLQALIGGNLENALANAKRKAIGSVREKIDHLCIRIAEKAAREQVFSLLPKKSDMREGGKRAVEIDYASHVKAEMERMESLLGAEDFVGILKRYPIRESSALDVIAKELGFQDRSKYESTVRGILLKDDAAVKYVRTLIGALPEGLVG